MPKPKPLSPVQAKRTLVHRLGARADRLRQFNTRFGIRPYRVFLVWSKWTGNERGEGDEEEVARHELLPTPKVMDLTSVAMSAFSGGTLPVGSVRLQEVSAYAYTLDMLTGKQQPEPHEDHIPEPFQFYYEIIEDGRGDPTPSRAKFRVAAVPFRDAGRLQWTILLERISEDNHRDGTSRAGDDT